MPTIAELKGMCTNADYLSADVVGDGMFLTIDHVQIDELKAPGGEAKAKPVVYFVEDRRGWVMNLTNLAILEAMFGPDTDGWAGKRLTLHNDKRIVVKRKGKPDHIGGIRVKSSPDIARSLKVSGGGNAFRKATDFVIEKVSVVDPLTEALAAHDLTPEQYDAWAKANSRPSFADTPAATRERAAQWIRSGGYNGILRANMPVDEPKPDSESAPVEAR